MSEQSYGDVTAEYLALRRGAGVVSGLHEAVRVSGPDAISFLQGLLSQDLSVAPGSVVRSFLLSPQGKLRALLWVMPGAAEVIAIVDRGLAGQVVSDLNRYRIRVDAVVDAVADPVVELWGPESPTVLERVDVPGSGSVPEGWMVPAPIGNLPRYFLTGVTAEALVEAGAVRCGGLAATTVRVEGGEPLMGVDVDESTIPQESGLVPLAVSFTKGCYLGQELVARIDSRGRVNQHLRGLVMQQNVLPPAGARVVSGERELGTLTSIGESLSLRAPVALALLRREAEPSDSVEVTWSGGSVPAVVRELPLDDFTDL